MERPNWIEYFMINAQLIATRSTCPRLSVGAVITKNNEIIATGYNGAVKGEDHCIDHGCLIQDGHCIRTIHAEMNAIMQCAKNNTSLFGGRIYVTHFPCINCLKSIIQCGIKEIYYLNDYNNNEYAEYLIQSQNIKIKKVDLTHNKQINKISNILDGKD